MNLNRTWRLVRLGVVTERRPLEKDGDEVMKLSMEWL